VSATAPELSQSPTVAERFDEAKKKFVETRGWRRLGVVLVIYFVFLALFGALVATQKVNPLGVYNTIYHSALLSTGSIPEVILRAVPIVLAALAVSVPARAGLVNVGGEGQLIVGAVAATGVGVQLGNSVPGFVGWILMAIAGMAAGALWGGVAGLLRVVANANEAVTTLLLNFIANDVMLYLLYQPWKDPTGGGQPESRPLSSHEILPKLFGSSINLGVIIALAAVLVLWYILKRSGWGLRVACRRRQPRSCATREFAGEAPHDLINGGRGIARGTRRHALSRWHAVATLSGRYRDVRLHCLPCGIPRAQ
jgi:ABC-type uncharacterized transport system permease subunit